MHYLKKASILALGILFALTSCLSLKQPRNKIEYYTFEYDPPVISEVKRLPHVLRIERFSVAPVFNTTQIVYRDKAFRRDGYSYHKWRVTPGDLVTYFLGRDLRHSNLYKAILPHGSRLPSSYRIEGSVDEFFELDTKEEWLAVLSLSITLMSENEPDISRRILFQQNYRTREACAEKNPSALAEAMSRAMARVSEKISRDIYNALKDL